MRLNKNPAFLLWGPGDWVEVGSDDCFGCGPQRNAAGIPPLPPPPVFGQGFDPQRSADIKEN